MPEQNKKKSDATIKISPELAESIKNEIRSLMSERGHNLNTLAKAYEEKFNRKMTVQNLGNKINKGTIRYFEYLEILDLLGFKRERPNRI